MKERSSPGRSPLTAVGALADAVRDSVAAPPSEEAVEAVEELFPEGDAFVRYVYRFTMLIVLSAGIAAFGLLADSAAVVIGAMLVAPLMTPITAAAAATVTARNVRLAKSLGVIVLGTALAIAVGYLTSLVAGTEITDVSQLPGEVRARTFPGLLDLGIAVTAGAAAGYILPRRSTVSALPGVGIAVALVPPLATVGITLEVGAGHEAGNAFLLYLTNLAAIVFAASVMLILTGFRPTAAGVGSLTRRLVITLTAVVAVAIPLTLHTRTVVRETSLQNSVAGAVSEWDDSVRVVDLVADIHGARASVRLLVSGPNQARPAWQLAEGIQRRFHGPVDLQLRYQQNNAFDVSVR
jgi:uncharacterized hydrophobic protein (TIGR00271 family)